MEKWEREREKKKAVETESGWMILLLWEGEIEGEI